MEKEPRDCGLMEKDQYVLEITLISAQGLKEPSSQIFRRIQTYAVAYIDPSHKLRTSVDRLGGANPTWNDKFLFKVTSDFLSKETSSVSVEIFSVGVLRDSSLGTVRLLVGNGNGNNNHSSAPSFTAVQVRRPSGRYHGVLNIGITVLETANVPSMAGVTAIGFRDLIRESDNSKKNRRLKKSKSAIPISVENLGRECDDDQSDDCYSTTTSSSSPAVSSTALKDWNGIIKELEKTNHVRSSSEDGSLACGLGLSNLKSTGCFSPFVFNGQSRFA